MDIRGAVSWGISAGLVGAAVAGAAPQKKAPAVSSGATLYQKQCAPCHGTKGEGGPGYAKALAGDKTPEQLAQLIARTMPPGPKHLPLAQARTVAAFAHDAFYSPIAQARNRPARIALSRLTVRQFKNAVADLIGSFRGDAPSPSGQGLSAEYFKSRWPEQKSRVTARVDPQVAFDFKTEAPVPGDIDPRFFCIVWNGGITAPDTGVYELVVRTEHAFQLFVNDREKPLIDAMVRSGKDNEFRASVQLVGGRTYPLRLEMRKSTQGVDDTEKAKKLPPPPASISLAWKRPKQPAEEIVPARCLTPSSPPEVAVIDTPFPPDDRSIGYERGTSVSKAWDEAVTSAALETADEIQANLRRLSGVEDGAKDREPRLKAFCERFVERALRRPLSADQKRTYVEQPFRTAPDVETAVRRVVLRTLMSPEFLYLEPGGKGDAYATASRLSFALWDSLPDAALLKAAETGGLNTPEQVRAQAERMVADPRAWAKLRDFLLFWLKVDQYPDLAKDPKRFPGFDAAAETDLRTALELYLENVAWGPRADWRELVLSDKVWLNGRLAKLYGANLPESAPFQPVTLDPDRAGVLTQPYVLASFAYVQNSSPIHRGVLVARSMLGRILNPPPVAVAPLAPSLHPNLTTRERVTMQTKPAMCSSCHNLINPLGYPLERFDAIGRRRTDDNGKPVDASGGYVSRTGQKVNFDGPKTLATYIAGSDEAHGAFVEKLFQHTVKQPIRAYGPSVLPDLKRGFVAGEFNMRKLLVAIATEAATR